jgi:hypothetical protein
VNSTDHKREFETQGYTIVRGMFSAEAMATLTEDIKAARPRAGRESGLNKDGLTFYSNVFFTSARLQAFVSQPAIVDLLSGIIGPDFWIRWDQCVAKGPGGVEFPWHQDNAYNRLKVQHYQFWFALTEMNELNGGLWLKPRSHLDGLLPHRMVQSHMVYEGVPDNPVLITASPGDVVVFSSMMLHYTAPNRSNDNRWAYVVEYMSIDDFDPFIEAPYFVVARNGVPDPHFVRFFRGRMKPANHIKYLGPRFRDATKSVRSFAGKALRRLHLLPA